MELLVMKLRTLLAAGAAVFVFAHSAQARAHQRHLYMMQEGSADAEHYAYSGRSAGASHMAAAPPPGAVGK